MQRRLTGHFRSACCVWSDLRRQSYCPVCQTTHSLKTLRAYVRLSSELMSPVCAIASSPAPRGCRDARLTSSANNGWGCLLRGSQGATLEPRARPGDGQSSQSPPPKHGRLATANARSIRVRTVCDKPIVLRHVRHRRRYQDIDRDVLEHGQRRPRSSRKQR